MMSIVNDVLIRPDGMGDEVWQLVSKATAKKPEDRFRSAAEFAEALREKVPPMTDAELGRMVSLRFPRQLDEYAMWERLAQEWSDRTRPVMPGDSDLEELEEEPPPDGA